MTTTSCLLHQIWTQFLFCHMLFISLLYKQCMDTATARHVCSTSLQANFTAHMRSDSSIASHTYTKLVFNFVLRLGSKWKREGIRRSMFPWRQQYIHVTIHFSEMPFLIYTLHTQAAKLTANMFSQLRFVEWFAQRKWQLDAFPRKMYFWIASLHLCMPWTVIRLLLKKHTSRLVNEWTLISHVFKLY